jgi:hypothetical protein
MASTLGRPFLRTVAMNGLRCPMPGQEGANLVVDFDRVGKELLRAELDNALACHSTSTSAVVE